MGKSTLCTPLPPILCPLLQGLPAGPCVRLRARSLEDRVGGQLPHELGLAVASALPEMQVHGPVGVQAAGAPRSLGQPCLAPEDGAVHQTPTDPGAGCGYEHLALRECHRGLAAAGQRNLAHRQPGAVLMHKECSKIRRSLVHKHSMQLRCRAEPRSGRGLQPPPGQPRRSSRVAGPGATFRGPRPRAFKELAVTRRKQQALAFAGP
mmetsp:Transcript_59458/g.169072  ORF Transcript_59458/g.169072 Transcript_59458/m.169072 type:complete len:207 (-) Transcript_59458:106-726(-)